LVDGDISRINLALHFDFSNLWGVAAPLPPNL